MNMRVEKKYGTEIIILEEGDFGTIWIEKDKLFKKMEDLFDEVKNNLNHPLRGKTFLEVIEQDVEDKMGWKKYLPELKKLIQL